MLMAGVVAAESNEAYASEAYSSPEKGDKKCNDGIDNDGDAADLPIATTTTALLERFHQAQVLDDQAVAQAFYSRFADVYDQLIVWLDFPFLWGFPLSGLRAHAQQSGARHRSRPLRPLGSLRERWQPEGLRTDVGTGTVLA